jgi:hypothetical protein
MINHCLVGLFTAKNATATTTFSSVYPPSLRTVYARQTDDHVDPGTHDQVF